MEKLKELIVADDPGDLSITLSAMDHNLELAGSGDRDAASILFGAEVCRHPFIELAVFDCEMLYFQMCKK
jgi:hypothetical protein